MARIKLDQDQSSPAIQRGAAFLSGIVDTLPSLKVVSSEQDSGKHFAAALKAAVSALLLVSAATLAQSNPVLAQPSEEQLNKKYQIDDLLTPTLNPKYTCQIDEDPIEQLNAWSPVPSQEKQIQTSEPPASDPQVSPLLPDYSSALDDIANEQAFDKLLSLFNPQIEAEIRWWCTYKGQSMDFAVAAHIFNPADWKATVGEWEKQIQSSAQNPAHAQSLREDLIHQIMRGAFEQAKTLTLAQIEATGIENPVLASAVLNLRAESKPYYDDAIGPRQVNLKTAAQGTNPLYAASRLTVRDSTGPAIAAGIAGAALGAVIANALNQRKAPPVVIYQNDPPQNYYQPPPITPYQAPQTYSYNPSTGSIIGTVQGALQGIAGSGGSYVPLTNYSPRPY